MQFRPLDPSNGINRVRTPYSGEISERGDHTDTYRNHKAVTTDLMNRGTKHQGTEYSHDWLVDSRLMLDKLMIPVFGTALC